MSPRALIQSLGALTLVLVSALLPAAPIASAAAAPWTWVRVVEPISVAPNSYYSIRAFCPAGYTAITGGLQVAQTSRIIRNAEYRFDDAAGSSWFVSFENTYPTSGTANVVAECVRTADLPAISHNLVEFRTDTRGDAEGTVGCLNAGEVVLTGGVDWSNVNTRWVYYNGPGWNGESWKARGWNSVAGARMAVEAYCVNPADVPGFSRIEHNQTGDDYWQASVTCPTGKRILNGGTEAGFANASYPSINKWTATGPYLQTTYVRAWCVDAGAPTVTLHAASPGPDGALTADPDADFTFSGHDPAGFPNGFQCSLDGSPPTRCSGDWQTYLDLSSGDHQFVLFNETADGRRSGLVLYRWTVDRSPPTVTAPRLPAVALTNPVRVTWKATDAHGVDHYEAALWRASANGGTGQWNYPTGWDSLASPSVSLPPLAQGDSACLAVRAVDELGNVSPWTAPTCTSRPYDDRALGTSTGWTRATGSSYWLSTITLTAGANRTLKRLNVTLDRVGVVATVCPSCGVVEVTVGSTVVGRITLERSALAHKQVLLRPAFSERTGAVTIKSVTSGKSIRIDGLVAIRRTAGSPP